jgi:DNA-binding CsgD family transcriptional regulator
MPIPRIETLSVFAAKLMDRANLTLAERSEAERFAQSMACKDSASAVGLPTAAVRACRKRIYEKLGVLRAGDLISALQMLAHGEPIEQSVERRSSRVPAGEPSGNAHR